MKLTTDLIFQRLSEHYATDYTVANNKNALVGRPIFNRPGLNAPDPDHICVITPAALADLPAEGGIFLCVGQPPAYASSEALELITVLDDVPITDVFNSLQEIFDHFDAWEDELNTIIETDGGYYDVVQCSTNYLGCPISLVDEDFSVVAISDKNAGDFRDELDQNKLSATIMSELITEPLFSKGLQNDDVFEFTIGGDLFLSYNFKKDSRYLGRVTLDLENRALREPYIFLLRFLAQRIDVMLRKFGSFLIQKEAFSALHAILSSALNNRPLDRFYTEAKLNENGWLNTDTYSVIRLQPEFRHEWQLHATYLIPMIERLWPGACAVEHDRFVAVLLNHTFYNSKSETSFIQELAYFLRDNLMLAGISRSFTGLEQLTEYYRQTELAITLGREDDPTCWYYRFDDYALSCWLKFGTLGFTPQQICSRVLLELLDYDRENNTEYYKTLRTFFNNKYSYTHAADDLYIHRTTLIKRIERIAELTHVNLDDPDSNLYIALSFRLIDKTLDPPSAGRKNQ
jgi:hypothetical protein